MSARLPDVGDVLDGRYRLDALLGEGAMGRVYDAWHLFMNRRVAVKLLHHDAGRASRAFARFRQEALAASRIEHPHIVAVHDFGVDHASGAPYVVQEYLEGHTLLAHLATAPGGRLAPREAVAIMAPVMSALDAAHAHGIIHRDIKPANIFLARGARGELVPKMIDFGVAKALTPLLEDAARTRDGQPVGTPAYMSREQAAGLVAVDARADVWAVGVVLFELLTGRKPYEAPTGSLLLVQVMSREPPPLGAVAPELPRALCDVVDRALQCDRDQRHASMADFLRALQAADMAGPTASREAPAPRPATPAPTSDGRADGRAATIAPFSADGPIGTLPVVRARGRAGIALAAVTFAFVTAALTRTRGHGPGATSDASVSVLARRVVAPAAHAARERDHGPDAAPLRAAPDASVDGPARGVRVVASPSPRPARPRVPVVRPPPRPRLVIESFNVVPPDPRTRP